MLLLIHKEEYVFEVTLLVIVYSTCGGSVIL